mmetsp:Transcript_10179/g.25523  ORF Transcript_10179/g.25523 Transcript_10179/m.25523 type:complete len:896 (-) Transcript_10179:15-2702(-)
MESRSACRYFLSTGTCSFGNHCKFSHQVGAPEGSLPLLGGVHVPDSSTGAPGPSSAATASSVSSGGYSAAHMAPPQPQHSYAPQSFAPPVDAARALSLQQAQRVAHHHHQQQQQYARFAAAVAAGASAGGGSGSTGLPVPYAAVAQSALSQQQQMHQHHQQQQQHAQAQAQAHARAQAQAQAHAQRYGYASVVSPSIPSTASTQQFPALSTMPSVYSSSSTNAAASGGGAGLNDESAGSETRMAGLMPDAQSFVPPGHAPPSSPVKGFGNDITSSSSASSSSKFESGSSSSSFSPSVLDASPFDPTEHRPLSYAAAAGGSRSSSGEAIAGLDPSAGDFNPELAAGALTGYRAMEGSSVDGNTFIGFEPPTIGADSIESQTYMYPGGPPAPSSELAYPPLGTSTAADPGYSSYVAQPAVPSATHQQQQQVAAFSMANGPHGMRTISKFFMSNTLRKDLNRRKRELLLSPDPRDPRTAELPHMIHRYHSILSLESPDKDGIKSQLYGFPTSVYKCTSTTDNLPYALRRIEGARLANEYGLAVIDLWRGLKHPNLVQLRELFMSKQYKGINMLYFAYDYYPGAVTLEEQYLSQRDNDGRFLQENVIWSFVCQIVSALRKIHSAGLACRVVHPSKILITGKNRLRLVGAGVFDVTNFDSTNRTAILRHQQEDLLSLGRLILLLCCRTSDLNNLHKPVDSLLSHYSRELKNLMMVLSTPAPNYPSADDVCTLLSARVMQEMDHLHSYTDSLENELSKEMDNGRLFRLISKLGFVNERPEFEMDPSWSETGDRYLLKLFRDYVFHQVFEDGKPVINFAHVVSCLNKLDIGSPEKIMLCSRDEQTVLVVSYADLKRCLKTVFNELLDSTYQVVEEQQGVAAGVATTAGTAVSSRAPNSYTHI